MTRRLFQHLALVLFPLTYGAGLLAAALRYLAPLPRGRREESIEAGKAVEFEAGLVRRLDFNESSVWVLHDGSAFRALDAKCTHLGCNVAWRGAEKAFVCPCHGARFDRTGKATKMPATGSLRELRIADPAQNGGKVIVLDQVKAS
jgi:Rieske Fe-S protein